jgi:hypothetical protein
MKTRELARTGVVVLLVTCLAAAVALANPYPPMEQKRPPLVLKAHGNFGPAAKSSIALSRAAKTRAI